MLALLLVALVIAWRAHRHSSSRAAQRRRGGGALIDVILNNSVLKCEQM